MTRPLGEYGDVAALADDLISLRWDAASVDENGDRDFSRHLLIDWNGGILWLHLQDLAADAGPGDRPHFGVDVRWIREADVLSMGLFVIEDGRRYTLAGAPGGLAPPEGSHGWSGGHCVSLLVDAPPLEQPAGEPEGDEPTA